MSCCYTGVSKYISEMTSKSVDKYADLQAYVMFIGYQQSGHSIIGSFLDAHPNAVVSHELDALKLWQEGIDQKKLFNAIVQNAWRVTQEKRQSYGYSYSVPGQWQGRYRAINVIGDKQGGFSTGTFGTEPDLIQKFRDFVGLPLRIVHVTRNPYDNIASIHLRIKYPVIQTFFTYLTLVQHNQRIGEQLKPDELIEFKHEDFIQDPEAHLVKLCKFIGLEPEPGYLAQCCSIVKRSPSRKRGLVEWPVAATDRIKGMIKTYSFLNGYTFDD